ncbi:MAG: glycosyltransferase family 9 protein [Candidatus Omnitrophica bacterium]|nr:glycosyltransferase family 9 protein [Candidatus Omnitrophota bacterium]
MPEIAVLKDIKKIVIFRTDRIGEVLLSTVCIDIFKKHFSKSRISFVTSGYSKDIVCARKDTDEVFVFSTISKKSSFIGLLGLCRYLKRNKFDLAVILNPHKLLHAAVFLSGIKHRLGYDRKWGFCLNHKIEDLKHEAKKHEIEYTLDLLKAIGIEAAAVSPRMEVSDKDVSYTDGIIKQFQLNNGKPIVVICAGSSNPGKMWNKENFISLINRIKNEFNCNIVLIGSSADKQVNTQAALDLTGVFTIGQLAAFFKKCRLFIGNDSGPMHIAAACGVSVVALFGKVSSPVRWRPWGKGHIILHKEDINKISVDEAIEAAKKII